MSELEKFSKEWHADYRQKVINEINRLNPSAVIELSKYSEDLIHYTVSVVQSEIKVEKNKRVICSSPDLLPEEYASRLVKSYYLTKQDAKNAIEPFLPAAQEKFKLCLEQYRAMLNKFEFSFGTSVDGDTHGVHIFDYISFDMGGFHFQFQVND